MQQHRTAVVVNLLLDAYRDGAKEKNAVRGRGEQQDLTPLSQPTPSTIKRSLIASITPL
jgi:hypothetical protein